MGRLTSLKSRLTNKKTRACSHVPQEPHSLTLRCVRCLLPLLPRYVISEDELSQITGAMVSVLEAGVELAD